MISHPQIVSAAHEIEKVFPSFSGMRRLAGAVELCEEKRSKENLAIKKEAISEATNDLHEMFKLARIMSDDHRLAAYAAVAKAKTIIDSIIKR